MEQRQHILENLIYAIIWVVILIVPVFGLGEAGSVEWLEVQRYWLSIAPFLILFVVNNYVLIPFFLLRKRSWLYLLFIVLTGVTLFTVFPLIDGKGRMPMPNERPEARGPMDRPPMDRLPTDRPPMDEPGERMGPPPMLERGQLPAPPPGSQDIPRDVPPPLFMLLRPSPMVVDWLIALLIVGLNLAMRFLFKNIRDDRQIKELEKQTLQTELNYLKAQINPHFFMNTLNNIHALIDIDTEKAKETVIELSKIMRYVLYEAEQARVPLAKEIQFLDNYTALMRIRYAEGVEIRTTFPEVVPEAEIPPLLLVTLLENAYKHGISYRHQSFIYSSLQLEDGRLIYMVVNSVFPDSPHPAGMGMENLRKRLSLLYGEDYSLDVLESETQYVVTLTIPLQ